MGDELRGGKTIVASGPQRARRREERKACLMVMGYWIKETEREREREREREEGARLLM